MTVNAITDTKKRRTGIAPTYLYTTLNIKYKIEINMHHRSKAMQYRQGPWAILTKFCVADGFLSLPFS